MPRRSPLARRGFCGEAFERREMKAVHVEKIGSLEVVDIPEPEVSTPYEVLIKVTAASICGSDIGIFKGTNSFAKYPVIIGHEYGGIVEKVGSLVTAVRPGDLVAVDPVRSCGHCGPCRSGRQNVCLNLKVCGVHLPGGFAEYVTAPEDRVHKVDLAKVPADMISLVEPYSIGVQVNRRARIEKGDRVLIMGCGPAGLCILEDAKARDAVVMMTDILDVRLEHARSLGANRVVNVTKEDVADAVMEFTNGEGMPVVVDSVCNRDSFPLALELAMPSGRVIVMGALSNPSEIAQVRITGKELDVLGTRLNNRRFPEVIDGMERGIYAPDRLRTHTFPFAKVEEAFDLAMNHPEKVRKVVLTF